MRRSLVTLTLVLLPALACAAGAATPPVAPAAPPPPAGPRIAIVDVQHVVMATEDGIRAQVVLKKVFDKRQADLDAKQAELARQREDIEQNAHAIPKDVLEKRMADWQRRMTELQSTFVEYNKELQKRQGELTAPIVKRLLVVIARTAEREGFDLVLDKTAVPFARPSLDLTDQMIKAYDAGG
jgi:outer membrane protein